MASSILKFWRTYRVVIIFPTLSASAILADLNHTKKWKQSLALKQQQQANLQ